MMRAPIFGMKGSGSVKVSGKELLKRVAMSRQSSIFPSCTIPALPTVKRAVRRSKSSSSRSPSATQTSNRSSLARCSGIRCTAGIQKIRKSDVVTFPRIFHCALCLGWPLKEANSTHASRKVFSATRMSRQKTIKIFSSLWAPGQPLAALLLYGCRVPLAGKNSTRLLSYVH